MIPPISRIQTGGGERIMTDYYAKAILRIYRASDSAVFIYDWMR